MNVIIDIPPKLLIPPPLPVASEGVGLSLAHGYWWIGQNRFEFSVIIRPQPDGRFAAYSAAIPGVVSEGDTLEETLAKMRKAIHEILVAHRADGTEVQRRQIPVKPNQLKQEFERRIVVDLAWV